MWLVGGNITCFVLENGGGCCYVVRDSIGAAVRAGGHVIAGANGGIGVEEKVHGLAGGDHYIVRGKWFEVAAIGADYSEVMAGNCEKEVVVEGSVDDAEVVGFLLLNGNDGGVG